MPKKLQSDFLTPGDGGRLITDVEPTQVPASSYRNKLNWRRETGSEVRSEGFVEFYPRTESGIMLQNIPAQDYPNDVTITPVSGNYEVSFTSKAGYTYILYFAPSVPNRFKDSGLAHIVGDGTTKTFVYTPDPGAIFAFFQVGGYKTVQDPILFVGTLNRANGDKTVIAATATDIFRFYAYNNQRYMEDGSLLTGGGYIVDGYFEQLRGEWVNIGTGFSPNTTKWEGVLINSTLVLNNGLDLPVLHRYEQTEVVPLYELRDNGVARVGTIAELSDILLCGDIYQLNDTKKEEITAPLTFDGVKAYQQVQNLTYSHPSNEWFRKWKFTDIANPSLISPKIKHSWDYTNIATVDGLTEIRDNIGSLDLKRSNTTSGQNVAVVTPPLEPGGPTQAVECFGAALLESLHQPDNALQVTYDYHETWMMFMLKPGFTGQLTLFTNTGYIAVSAGKLYWVGLSRSPSYTEEITGLTTGKWYILRLHTADTGTVDSSGFWPLVKNAESEIEIRDRDNNIVYKKSQTHDAYQQGSVWLAGTDMYFTQIIYGQEALTSDEANKVWDYFLDRHTSWMANYGSVDEKAELHDGSPVSGEASKSKKQITASTGIFASTDANQVGVVVWSGGDRKERDLIDAFTDTQNVTVLTEDEKTLQPVSLYRRGTQLTSDQDAADSILAAGKIVRFPNGIRATISSVTGANPQVATLDTSDFIYPAREFVVHDDDSDNYNVVATEDVFTTDMVGGSILFDSGEERKIVAYIDARTVKTNKDDPISLSGFRVTNPDQYSRQEGDEDIDRFSYRVLWSAIDMPQMFAANATAKVVAGSRTIVLKNPVKWVECGCSITITEAGPNGANLTADIQSVSHGNTVLRISEIPSVSIDDAVIESTAQIGNIVGFDELDQDSRAILKMVPLTRERLAVYKEQLDGVGSIFIMQYQGQTNAPFAIEKVYEGAEVPAFPQAIIQVMGEWHLYAGHNAFYRFDGVNQRPEEINTFRYMEATFFDEVDRSDIDQIFMAINTITKEIFLFYPSITTTKCIRYDYRNETISLSDMSARAAGMIRRPSDDEEWFVMGNADGTLTRYGLVDDDNIAITASQTGTTVSAGANTFSKEHVGRTIKWADGTYVAIIEFIDDEEVIVDTSSEQASQSATILPGVWHRLGNSYDSTLESGLDHFRGEGWGQVLLERYAPRFGIFTPCNVTLVGTKTSNGDPVDVKTKAISAENQTMMTTIMTRFYWGDRLSVSGKNNPCSVIGRNFRTKVIDAKGFRT